MEDAQHVRFTMMENAVQEIKQRVGNLEEKMNLLDKSSSIYSAIFEKNLQTQEKLSSSIDNLSRTTMELQGAIQLLQTDIKASTENQEKMSKYIEKVEIDTQRRFEDFSVNLMRIKEEVKTVDEKSHFDIMIFVKNNIVAIILGLVVLVQFVQQVLKNVP